MAKTSAAAKASSRWSLLTAAEAVARLASKGLSKPVRDLVKHALRREEAVLWCDGAWARPKKPPASDLTKVALIVIDGPLVTTRGLSLRYADLVGGGYVARDEVAFLFLGEVRAADVFTVPGVLALFTEGLTVDRIASFEGADVHVSIARRLHAPIVVSGISGSGANLVKDTDVRIGAYARHIVGLPRRAAQAFESLGELLPFLADQVDDVDAWELLEARKDTKLPKGFVLPEPPPRARPPSSGAGRSAGPPKRAAAKVQAKPKHEAARGPEKAKKPLETVTRTFENASSGMFCQVVIEGASYKLYRGSIGGKPTRPLVCRFGSSAEALAEARSFIKTALKKPWREVAIGSS